jgi:hypothetical protein
MNLASNRSWLRFAGAARPHDTIAGSRSRRHCWLSTYRVRKAACLFSDVFARMLDAIFSL